MPRVAGIERFREAMSGHEGEYVLIGGGACSILFDEAGANFRLTKDLDIVVLVDDAGPSFGRAVWGFVREGGYEAGKRREGGCTYYRFTLPEDSPNTGAFPGEIELFARHPDFELEDEGSHVAPLPFDGTVSSLSAIILDDGYYEFIRANVTTADGVPLLSALHIIPAEDARPRRQPPPSQRGRADFAESAKKAPCRCRRACGLVARQCKVRARGAASKGCRGFLRGLRGLRVP